MRNPSPFGLRPNTVLSGSRHLSGAKITPREGGKGAAGLYDRAREVTITAYLTGVAPEQPGAEPTRCDFHLDACYAFRGSR